MGKVLSKHFIAIAVVVLVSLMFSSCYTQQTRVAYRSPDEGLQGGLLEYMKLTGNNPRNVNEFIIVGLDNFRMARFNEAASIFLHCVESGGGNCYIHILLFVSRARVGKDGTVELVKFYDSLDDANKWPAPVIRMLLGQITPEECLASATHNDIAREKGLKCEAYFYIAQIYLIRGDKEKATTFFKNCIKTGITNFFEYRLARAELMRLVAE